MDFAAIFDAITVTGVVTAILGGCAICAQVKFGLWAAPKVARLFLMRKAR